MSQSFTERARNAHVLSKVGSLQRQIYASCIYVNLTFLYSYSSCFEVLSDMVFICVSVI